MLMASVMVESGDDINDNPLCGKRVYLFWGHDPRFLVFLWGSRVFGDMISVVFFVLLWGLRVFGDMFSEVFSNIFEDIMDWIISFVKGWTNDIREFLGPFAGGLLAGAKFPHLWDWIPSYLMGCLINRTYYYYYYPPEQFCGKFNTGLVSSGE